jgi:hypothetical protein
LGKKVFLNAMARTFIALALSLQKGNLDVIAASPN